MRTNHLSVVASCMSVAAALFTPVSSLAGVFTFLPTPSSYVQNFWTNFPDPGVSEYLNYFPEPFTVNYSYYDDDTLGIIEEYSNSYLLFDLDTSLARMDIVSASLKIDILEVFGGKGATAGFVGTADNLLTRERGANTIDVRSLVLSSLASASGSLTLATTYSDPNKAGLSVAFDSQFTNGNTSNSPFLEIVTRDETGDPVPEPATVLLLGAGLLGLAGVQRRKKR